VLAVLLLHLNEAVETQRLVDEVWGDDAPLTAAKIVHNNVSRLRRLFERDVALAGHGPYELLLRHRGGYELRLEPEQLDALVFERRAQEGTQALTEGDPIVASAQLREALALWRGPALAEFAEAPFAEPERTRLEELRLAAIANRVEADLAAGGAAELVAELEAIIAQHPLRERLRGHLMLALYRAGREADALRVYQDTRRLLVDELGIDPSPALQRLQRAILLHDPALELEPPGRDEHREPATPHRLREVRKTVSVVITEILPLGPALDAEVLHEPLVRTLDDVSRALEGHGGAVDRAIGGVTIAVFGIPAVHEDDPLRAVRAALDARRAVAAATERLERELGVRLALRTAVVTGDVLADAASAGTAGIAGAAIDAALRLHGEAQPDEILVADATWRLLRDRLRVQPLIRARGGTKAWRLEGVLSDAPVGRGREPPLVGRERELGALGQALELTLRERTPYLFTILGPAGIGKSRLANEFASSLGGQAAVLRGRCLSYGDGIALWPLAEMVEQLCGGDAERLAGLLAREPEGAVIAERIAAGVGLSASPTSTDDTFWAVWKLVETLARARPLVLIVEDLQWAAPTLLDLVEHVVDRSRAPLLVVCVARAELLDERSSWGGGKPNATSIRLGPLSNRESLALIGTLAAGATIGRDTLARLAAVAEGNPLFLERRPPRLCARRSPDRGGAARAGGRPSRSGSGRSIRAARRPGRCPQGDRQARARSGRPRRSSRGGGRRR
jgi:DNA-binding SARP family transcriptional activator/class 3 adenylate cyclase